MSSSFRNRAAGHLALTVAGLALLAGAPGAFAQQTLFLPGVETQADYNTNRELSPDDKESRTGYRATLEARIRRLTPRSDTEMRPQISYQKYTGRSDLDNVEGRFDIRSRYQTLKGQFGLFGRLRRQDAFNAELGQASFDNDDPNVPDDVPTGVVSGGITRSSALFQPSFEYSLTERTDLEGSVRYDYVDYDSNLARERVGYSSPSIDLNLAREISQRFRVGVGPYYSHYEADDNSGESDSYGAMVNLRWKTSDITRSVLRFRVERTKDIDLEPVRVEEKATAWGVEWIGTKENRVGSTEYRIGRFLQPTSLGGRREVDQVQVQLDRPLSHRTLVRAAVRYTRAKEISDLDTGGDRDQAQGDFLIRHFFTESFFMSGGYRYAWVDRDLTGSADNHSVFFSIGLRKRDPSGPFKPL